MTDVLREETPEVSDVLNANQRTKAFGALHFAIELSLPLVKEPLLIGGHHRPRGGREQYHQGLSSSGSQDEPSQHALQ